MATYTSTQNGAWNTDATWGGAGHPTANGDIVNIRHQVTWDRGVDTVTFNNIFIPDTGSYAGMLVFPVNSSWKLLFDATGTLTINATGEIRTGTTSAADYLGTAYLGQIHWDYPAAVRNSMILTDGGKINLWGADIYSPENRYADLDSDWTTGDTLYVTGDYSAKWFVNQYFYIHDNATSYASSGYTNQGVIYRIHSSTAPTYDSGNDRTAIKVTAANPTKTCDALNATTGRQSKLILITRNLELGDPNNTNKYVVYTGYGYTERIKFDNNQAVTTTRAYLKNCLLFGWEYAIDGGYNFIGENLCFVSNNNGIITGINHQVTGDFVSNNNGINGGTNHQVTGDFVSNSNGINIGINHQVTGDFVSNSIGIYGGTSHQVTGDFVSNSNGISTGTSHQVTGDFVSNNNGISGGTIYQVTGDFVSNSIGISGGTSHQVTGDFVSNSDGISGGTNHQVTGDFSSNTNDILNIVAQGQIKNITLEKCTLSGTNQRDLRIYANAGNILPLITGETGAGGTAFQTPDSGNSYILEAIPNSNCAQTYSDRLPLSPMRDMGIIVPASATTLTVKIWPVGGTTSLDQDDVKLMVRYLNTASGNTRTTAYNTTATYANAAWRSVSVTFTPSQAGVVYWNLFVGAYELGKTILIDPVPVVS